MTEDNIKNTKTNNRRKSSRFSSFIKKLIPLISIWLTIVLMIYFKNILPEFDWPWYLDKILIAFTLFLLIYWTLDFIKPLFFIIIFLGVLYFSYDVIFKENENTSINKNNIENLILSINKVDTNLINDIKQSKIELSTLKNKVDSLEIIINELQCDSNIVDSLNQK